MGNTRDRESLVQCLWSQPRGWAELVLWPLDLAALVYRAGVAWRNRGFDTGRWPITTLPVPVISVGNLVVGGAGKTPLTLALAQAFTDRGRRVGIVTRGYGGSAEGGPPVIVSIGAESAGADSMADTATVGDEAVLLARRLPHVPVVACACRVDGGRALLDGPGADLILLDDGFQHRALARDADVVVVSGGDMPFGNGAMLPRGPLREPLCNIARADLVVVRDDDETVFPHRATVAAHTRVGAPLLVTGAGTPHAAWQTPLNPPPTAHTQVFAVCGIAAPARFLRTLAGGPFSVCGHWLRADHARYRPQDVAQLARRAADAGAEAVVTTEKDAVKLAPAWRGPLPLWVVPVTLELAPEVRGALSADSMDTGGTIDALLRLADARFAARTGGGSAPGMARSDVDG